MSRRLSRRDFIRLSSVFTASSLTLACGLLVEDVSDLNIPEGTDSNPETPIPQAQEMGEPETRYEVIVIGGGIAGLTAAYLLQDAGQDVLVLEHADQPGGRALTGIYKGVHYARGAEYLGEPEGALRRIIRKLDLETVMIPDPMDAHYHAGRFYWNDDGIALMHIQDSGLNTVNRFIRQVQDMQENYIELPDFNLDSEIASLDNITARQWFEQNGYSGSLQEAYNVAARGLFGANLDEISALSYIPEIAFDFEDSEPIEDVEDLDNIPNRMGYDTGSYTFKTGITEVTQALADALGKRLHLDATAGSVTQTGNTYRVRYILDGEEHLLAADRIILAVPAPAALEIASSVLDEPRRNILAQIPYSQYLTLALFSDEPIFNRAFDLAVPDGWFFTDIYDSTWVERTYTPSLPGNVWVAGVYIAPHSYKDNSLHGLDEQEAFERVMADLEQALPGARSKVTGYELTRFPYAYPVMVPGAYQRLLRLHQLNRGSLILAGDYMIYPTFEAACDSGELAAEKVL
ncbi:MAG: FAD-dependent oxidoreductase [Anaerolineales bacterium]|nr:FAD-dependent oxidoreductase [Anaerolineales bacterium]